ncbi:type II and III secretion system protein [Roseiterribacter gracilis]|uniref:Type II/III secretion system secretin-like domain-containing protein n=1 Tax=Roseiterribacter gracilis TaxID=2812848 RepID=A0A8S8XDM7_9PROT|nr:hypothetical protein TMPK1_23290 [Rhodospirillales bacterium TMPK1]
MRDHDCRREPKKSARALRAATWAALIAALGGCAGDTQRTTTALPNAATISAALKDGADEASAAAIRRALQQRPRDAALHFANGLSYLRSAEAGSQTSLELAQVGYETAARLDPGFWPARAGLGWLAFEQRRPDDAMLRFADALLLAPKRAELWVGLAASAYDAHKLAVARAAIERALELAPERTDARRVAALVFAAAGDDKAAHAQLEAYGAAAPREASFLAERIDNWGDLHRAIVRVPEPGGARLQLAVGQSFPPDTTAGNNSSSSSSSASDDYSDDTNDSSSDGSPGSYYGPKALRPLKKRAGGDPKMVLVDVVIIREEETTSTGKGVNLLDGLTVQLGGSLTAQSQVGQSSGASFTRVLAGSVTIPAVTYDLDIANVSGTRAEVVARPTLVALDGQASRFFSGDELTIALAGQYGGDLEHKAIGIGLSVTPTVTAPDRVLLRVITERESISPQLAGTFTQSVQTTRNTVTANVAMRFGETLVLSGLLDREAKSARSGVPVLQSIPGVQYLFSRDEDARSQRSLLVTMTPRHPEGAKLASQAENAERDQMLSALQGRVPTFRPDPSLDRVVRRLEAHGLLREFRAGDLGIHTTDEMRDRGFLEQALRFLYY